MSKPRAKVTIPEVIGSFVAYKRREPSWGVLHVVLEEGNYRRSDVVSALDWADQRGDGHGHMLACILLKMSKSQMKRLDHQVSRLLRVV